MDNKLEEGVIRYLLTANISPHGVAGNPLSIDCIQTVCSLYVHLSVLAANKHRTLLLILFSGDNNLSNDQEHHRPYAENQLQWVWVDCQ